MVKVWTRPHKAVCEWMPISVHHGTTDSFHLRVTVNDRVVVFPSVTFATLEKLAIEGDPSTEQAVERLMTMFD